MRVGRVSAANAARIPPLLLLPFTVRAHTLAAPTSVHAQPDGSFAYEVRFTAGPGTAEVAAYEWFGIENINGGLVSDCFCPGCVLDPEESIVLAVEGMLVDPTQGGWVHNGVDLCTGHFFQSLTRVKLATDVPEEETAGLDRATGLFWNSPNPFVRQTTFHYVLPETGPVQLRIYNVAGRVVATPLTRTESAGSRTLTWEALDDTGRPLPRGIYFADLRVGDTIRSRRLVITN